jgi:hypothetical protein
MEMLVRTKPRVWDDPMSMDAGHVVDIKPDNHTWGRRECAGAWVAEGNYLKDYPGSTAVVCLPDHNPPHDLLLEYTRAASEEEIKSRRDAYIQMHIDSKGEAPADDDLNKLRFDAPIPIARRVAWLDLSRLPNLELGPVTITIEQLMSAIKRIVD